jgi:hypothetical protein
MDKNAKKFVCGTLYSTKKVVETLLVEWQRLLNTGTTEIALSLPTKM